ncbi:MAG: type 1 glutamine amidotransferase domain-containing protein [Flavobacteriaceae bacterium]|jgi:putative intracellular protease/amidase|nr:type 1 glutamine amidotransferase domain-containing protein [Flavobacteriaceae bacterium]MBT4951369.1 type 1 glutamine amidotransferase domain-containing protein [Pelagibacteraceae bacterium]MBT5215092.1 type 1 glutamine amidotransferase domain-containing protein [Pelagibacteraceae bacterium]MBT6170857.1 type 1 glutamine amidotransferase domain-containing protein [Flavobacteriaceae bacterium]MBT6448430.1 type 1 glutamine amidotransferase domain-containing protein [Flavobacteriaceae bacterium
MIKIIGFVSVLFILFLIALPTLLHKAGLHPQYKDSKVYNFKNKKAVIITTSHNLLNKPGEKEGKLTGVFASELTVPYYEFLDSGVQVDVASVKGGEIPIDPESFFYAVKTIEDKRYLKDKLFQDKVKNSILIDNLKIDDYDFVFISGGWGAAYDLGYSEILGEKISQAYYSEKTIIGAVCHGVLGFIKAKDSLGKLIIKNRRMTGVTNKQIKELGIDFTPQHPEDELIKAGAIFESKTAFRDAFADLTITDDNAKFVTGQNQNAGHETPQKMMEILKNK